MLTDPEKARVRYHLGYPQTDGMASIQLGIPKATQTGFLCELAMNLLTDVQALATCREILSNLDKIDSALITALCQIGVASLGEIKLHPLAQQGQLSTDSLRKEYTHWADRLADLLGTPKYPYSTRSQRHGPGTMIPVR